jgi:hypothetical protein
MRSHLSSTLFKVDGWEPKLITKSGPGVVSEPLSSGSKKIMPIINMYDTTGAILVQGIQLVTGEKFKNLYSAFKKVADITGQVSLVNQLESIVNQASKIPDIYSRTIKTVRRINGKRKTFSRIHSFLPTYLGRLGAKEEPGKVRVFAMVD